MKRYFLASLAALLFLALVGALASWLRGSVPPSVSVAPSKGADVNAPTKAGHSIGLASSTAFATTTSDPAATCQSAKLTAAALASAGLLRCEKAAAKTGNSPESECLSNYRSGLSDAFGSAETAGGCTTQGDASSVASVIGAFVQATATQLRPTSSPSKCAAAKFASLASSTTRLLKAYAKDRNRPNTRALMKTIGKEPAAVAKAFSRAEVGTDCLTQGDASTMATAVSDFAGSLAQALYPFPTGTVHSVMLAYPPALTANAQSVLPFVTSVSSSSIEISVDVLRPPGYAVSEFDVSVFPNPDRVDLSHWFATEVDQDGVLTRAGTYVFTHLPDGRDILEADRPIPDNYDVYPIVGLFLMTADHSFVATVSLSQVFDLPLGSPESQREFMRAIALGLSFQ